MGRRAKYTFPLQDGRVIGASFKVQEGYFRVRFLHPTEPDRYLVLSTGVEVPRNYDGKKDPPPDAFTGAAKIILKAYTPTLPPDLKRLTWDQCQTELNTAPIRPRTLGTYTDALNHLRRLLPDTKGPINITPEIANKFARLYGSEKYSRGKAPDAPTYTRSAQTVFNAVANLSIVWSHFADMGFVEDNPWDKVKRPKLSRRQPSIPTDDAVSTLFGWLNERFPGWELAKLFLEVKALSGCRLNDLCQVRSVQLKGTILTITADQDKTHRERAIPLPADIAARLHAIKGSVFLWERYVEDARVYRKGRRNECEFRPSLMYNGMKWVFKEYQKAHPEAKVKSHDLRKRAITLTAMATQSVDQTAAAIGVTGQTASRYYVDAKKAFDGMELMRKMAGVLRPCQNPAVGGTGGES